MKQILVIFTWGGGTLKDTNPIQVAGPTGPTGPTGPRGTNGTNGVINNMSEGVALNFSNGKNITVSYISPSNNKITGPSLTAKDILEGSDYTSASINKVLYQQVSDNTLAIGSLTISASTYGCITTINISAQNASNFGNTRIYSIF